MLCVESIHTSLNLYFKNYLPPTYPPPSPSNQLKTSQPRKQLKLHPLPRLRPSPYLAQHIRPGRKIVLETRLPRPFHVGEHGLAEVPVEQLVGGSVRA